MGFKVRKLSNVKLNNCTAICGFPGAGNVAKIAIDYLIDNLNAKPLLELFSTKLHSSVLIEPNGLVYLPSITFYYKKLKNKNFIFITGANQPVTSEGCYELSEKILNILKDDYDCKKIVTFGGIAMTKLPKKIDVFATGNHEGFIKEFPAKTDNVFEVSGPIIGMAGVLTAMAEFVNIKSVLLLAQTRADLTYLGFNGSKEILKVINKKYGFGVKLGSLSKDAKWFENELGASLGGHSDKNSIDQIFSKMLYQDKHKSPKKDMNYFG